MVKIGGASLEEVSPYFHLPIEAAARELGVCSSALKRRCRRLGIKRWPFRKVRSMSMSLSRTMEDMCCGGATGGMPPYLQPQAATRLAAQVAATNLVHRENRLRHPHRTDLQLQLPAIHLSFGPLKTSMEVVLQPGPEASRDIHGRVEHSQSSSVVSNAPSPWDGPSPWRVRGGEVGSNREPFSHPPNRPHPLHPRPQKRSGGVRPSKDLQHLSLTAVAEPLAPPPAPLASLDISLLHMPMTCLFSPPASKLLLQRTHPHPHPNFDSYFHHYLPPVLPAPLCDVKAESGGGGGWGVDPQEGSLEEAFTPKTREMMAGFEETFAAADGEDHSMRGVRVISTAVGGRGVLSPSLSSFLESSPPFATLSQQLSFTDLLTMTSPETPETWKTGGGHADVATETKQEKKCFPSPDPPGSPSPLPHPHTYAQAPPMSPSWLLSSNPVAPPGKGDSEGGLSPGGWLYRTLFPDAEGGGGGVEVPRNAQCQNRSFLIWPPGSPVGLRVNIQAKASKQRYYSGMGSPTPRA